MSEESTGNLFEAKLNTILIQLQAVDLRLDGMNQRLAALEAKQYDTKPIWEKALAELLEIKERLDRIDKEMVRQDDKLDHFIEDVIEMKRQMRRA